jgi:hypothetical protein
MTDRRWRWALAVAIVLCGRGPAADDAETGFTRLFNDKDLTGWRYEGMKGASMQGRTSTPDRRIDVRDGIIIAHARDAAGKGGIKNLYTAREYNRDFTLRLEFRASPRSDSGVYIRCKQLQVRDYPTVGPYKNLKQFKDGGWNDLEIIVRGTAAECRCNGEVLEKAFKVPEKGAIGLQAETGKFEFRNVRIRETP